MNKKWKAALIALLCVAVLGGGVYGVLRLLKSHRSKPVNVYAASNFILSGYDTEAETEGLVTTDRIQSIYLTSTQRVTEIYVTEGQTVKEGEPLLAFDTTLSDLELERKDIEIRQLRLRLEKAQKQRREMDSYSVYSGYTPTYDDEPEDEPELEPAPYMPYLTGGEGTKDAPYIYLWNDDCPYSDGFLQRICPPVTEPTPDPDPEPEPEPDPAPDDEPEPDLDEAAEPEEATEPTEETDPEEERDPEEEASDEPSEEPEEPVYNERWAIFEVREADSPEGEVLRVWEMRFWRSEDNALQFEIFQPAPDYDGGEEEWPEEDFDFGYDGGAVYTASELRRMKAEADRQLEQMELQLRQAELAYETIGYELSNGVVTAKIDGVVKTLREPDEALAANEPVLLLSGGGGYYVEALMSELELGQMQIGDEVTVVSWESGVALTGAITAISDYPKTDGWYWSSGNSNVSHYPFTVFLDEDSNLRENEYVSVRFSTDADTAAGVFLEKPFIRTENGRSYIYVQAADGTLEKRFVQTGRELWGSYVELLTGLTEDDYIAFPYGRDVTEGAKTVQASVEELYGVYY